MGLAVETTTPTQTTETPSGRKIEFWAEPHSYRVDGEQVPSVTQITDALAKDLSWWGQEVGIKGVLDLWSKGLLMNARDGRLAVVHPTENVWVLADLDTVTEQLKLQKLTTSYVVGAASIRGTAVHEALENWAVTREFPSAENYPPNEQPYIRAVRAFAETVDDYWETQGIELTVASKEHRFAGRYDLRGICLRDTRVVTRALRKDGSAPLKSGHQYLVIPAGTTVMFDLKTSKRIYFNHVLQLAAYEGASIECGHPPTDWRCTLHATTHGVYEVRRVNCDYEHFLAVRRVYDAMQAAKELL